MHCNTATFPKNRLILGTRLKDCCFFSNPFSSTDYTGQGVDQLQKIIDTIKKNPDDRQIIMFAWNPKGESELLEPFVKHPGGLLRSLNRV